MLASHGHWRGGLAGQITSRGSEKNTFLTLRFGEGADEAQASRLALINDNLEVLNGDFSVNPANRFHIWIYRHRPDINCIVHTHPPAASALSMVGNELAVAHMDATPFFDQCAYLPEWPGLPIDDNEGEIIANALGNKSSIASTPRNTDLRIYNSTCYHISNMVRTSRRPSEQSFGYRHHTIN
jgi:L-fuculose-phosphate aldolase